MFKFDDIYFGMLAHRLNIKPQHIDNIYYYPASYYPSTFARTVIASHGFEKEQLASVWKQLEYLIKFKAA